MRKKFAVIWRAEKETYKSSKIRFTTSQSSNFLETIFYSAQKAPAQGAKINAFDLIARERRAKENSISGKTLLKNRQNWQEIKKFCTIFRLWRNGKLFYIISLLNKLPQSSSSSVGQLVRLQLLFYQFWERVEVFCFPFLVFKVNDCHNKYVIWKSFQLTFLTEQVLRFKVGAADR